MRVSCHINCCAVVTGPCFLTQKPSTQAFIALHEALRQRDSFALCSYVRNARSGVALVAVLPAVEAINEDTGVQVSCCQLQPQALLLGVVLPRVFRVKPKTPDTINPGHHFAKPWIPTCRSSNACLSVALVAVLPAVEAIIEDTGVQVLHAVLAGQGF